MQQILADARRGLSGLCTRIRETQAELEREAARAETE
jgi:hypothetical protein